MAVLVSTVLLGANTHRSKCHWNLLESTNSLLSEVKLKQIDTVYAQEQMNQHTSLMLGQFQSKKHAFRRKCAESKPCFWQFLYD